ncbi:CBS-domain-containing protein [Candidatus Caldarchaeum subterraneum]|uniref:CBS-domain-containing protein n=1 Tax=Caldiarchaeum subterraneum TaxID=311458 RepID=E6N9B9_CALS0|nr:CBS-domain-containing protein [Candidatus Caldarchaeum subterraneum]BAJ51509.1 CBS-domain-containing protein [Candidatus Caldarchaeum subterraneum]
MVKPATLVEELRVRDVMSSPVVEADAEASAVEVAELMRRYGIGSVVISSQGKPVGIITKTDLVTKVVANGTDPNTVRARDIMTTPLQTVEPDVTIDDALSKMNKLKLSRLVVVYKERLAGIVTIKDILQVTPEILSIVREKLRIGTPASASNQTVAEGYCELCGEWSDYLVRVEDQLLCEDCRIELERKGGASVSE